MQNTGASLLQRLQQKDKSALKQLFEEQYIPVCSTINRIIRDRATTEDLAQDLFIRFWNKVETLKIEGEIPPYLRRMAINEALGYLRRTKNKQTEEIQPYHHPSETAPDAESGYLYGELEGQIKMAMESLPPRCRQVFHLSRMEGKSYKEIAETLGISIKTVENQMGKALKILRERLKGYLAVLFL